MKLDKNIISALADMEQIIGSECYNPRSYDGWNGIEGKEFRYPVTFSFDNGGESKTRLNIKHYFDVIDAELEEETIRHMKYKFGSNELYVGQGLIKVLEYLEKRYGIDFNELEKEHE